MSFESQLHASIVRRLCSEIKATYSDRYAFALLADLPEFGRNKPYTIGGYIPDVFGIDVPETVRVIGEAKTPADFESDRSQRQIAAFLKHLSVFPSSEFFLGLPLPYVIRGRSLLNSIAQSVGATHVQMKVLGG
jgi:hypothetical protein